MVEPRAVELVDLPRFEPNVSDVELVALHRRLFLAYQARPIEDESDASEEEFAVVEFRRWSHFSGGSPNDEALHNHPMWPFGVRWESRWEVLDSPAIEELGDLAHKDGKGRPSSWMRSKRHFVFAFKEGTFDCFAEGYHLHGVFDSHRAALRAIEDALDRHAPWEQEPADRWASLEERVPKVPCRDPDCDGGAVRFSVFCREHHIAADARASARLARSDDEGDS